MVKMCHNQIHLTNHKSQRQSSSVQTTFLPMFSQNRLKPTNNFLEVVNSFVRFFMVKRCHNPMHLANHKSQRQSSSVQTTFIPMFSQKRLKHTKKFLVEVNSFVSFSMVKMCHNLMHLTNYKCLIWIRSVQTKFIPILSKKTLKPKKIYLEVVNNFVSVSMVEMCHNPMHLTIDKS